MASSYTVEESYDKRLKGFRNIMLITGVIVEILTIYLGLMIATYTSVYPQVPFMTAVFNAIALIPQKPLYFIPIDYPILMVIISSFAVLLLLFVMYAIEVKKIHHNINTIKGSAEWQNALELTKRFAEYN